MYLRWQNEPEMLKCLTTLMGLSIGFALGWTFHFIIPSDGSEVYDAATRLLMFLFGVLGWAFTEILGHDRQLHCGGTKPLDTAARQRYVKWGAIGMPTVLLAVGFISSGHLFFYFLAYLVIAFLLIGEICWGDPKQLIAWAIGWDNI